MVDHHGCFAWYELLTTDMAAAKAFYRDVVGWDAQDASTREVAYSHFTFSDAPVAGLMDLPEEGRRMGATPRWIGYVAVDDVDMVAERLRRLGGALYVPPTDTNIGRISIIADPQTASLAMVSGLKPERRSAVSDEVGQVGWHELLAADGAKAFAFYSELFGWQKATAMTPTIDSYELFAADGVTMGGIFTKFVRAPSPFWLYYFNVSDIAVAAARVKAGGGQVAQGPMELADGSWIVRCIDPQGAMFALQGESSQHIEQPATEVGFSAAWGGFTSRGKMIAASKPKTTPKPDAKPPKRSG